ncbi:MAG: transcriptional attenuator, LytR family [Actinomycetia bacterium]|nr:transcriptional attenuator, LytR family [Actinomycetes bacterium]
MTPSFPASMHAFWSRFVVALVLCVSLSAGGIAGAYWFANDKWNAVTVAPISPDAFSKTQKGKPANFLIIGSDTRAFAKSASDQQHFGSPNVETGQRSDTIMIAHIDPRTNTGMVVSFPRDLMVDIPGLGRSRINAAFNYGPQRIIETLKQNFNIPIHHYLEVDFAGFQDLVNAVGSVPIYFTTPARDTYTGLQILLPGCYHLNGADALAYVRSRHYQYKNSTADSWHEDPFSDLGRIQRQQYFIRSLAQVAITTAAHQPLKANNILDKAFASLTRDKGLALSDMSGLAATLRNADPAVVKMMTIPTTVNSDNATLSLDPAKAEPVLQQLRSFTSPKSTTATVPKDVVPNQVTVKVLNGSGVRGKAATTLTALGAAGFQPLTPPADADRSDYATTEVRYATGALHKAQLVAAYLGTGNLVAGGNVVGSDVTVVLGRDFQQVSTPTTVPPSTTPQVTTATVPATGPRANPGQVAGTKVQPLVGC